MIINHSHTPNNERKYLGISPIVCSPGSKRPFVPTPAMPGLQQPDQKSTENTRGNAQNRRQMENTYKRRIGQNEAERKERKKNKTLGRGKLTSSFGLLSFAYPHGKSITSCGNKFNERHHLDKTIIEKTSNNIRIRHEVHAKIRNKNSLTNKSTRGVNVDEQPHYVLSRLYRRIVLALLLWE